jgi:hypothetical protein
VVEGTVELGEGGVVVVVVDDGVTPEGWVVVVDAVEGEVDVEVEVDVDVVVPRSSGAADGDELAVFGGERRGPWRASSGPG